MAIPEEILRVERPKNTFVVCYGSRDNPKYSVRKCIYSKRFILSFNFPFLTLTGVLEGIYLPELLNLTVLVLDCLCCNLT